MALRARLNAQLSGLLNLNFSAGAKAQQQQAGQAKDQSLKEEEAFAFRLFRDEAPTHTVVLTHDEDPATQADGGFVAPSRPRSHYIASAPSSEKESEFRSVAVSAEYLLADARKRRWGLEKPWRVIHISSDFSLVPSSNSISKPEETAAQTKVKEKKRTRPGKKHRLLSRVREKAKHEREEAAKKLALDKEQHLQEKKKRLNRERKLKRRQKEREKKAALQTTDHDGGGTNDDAQKSDDDETSVHSGEEL